MSSNKQSRVTPVYKLQSKVADDKEYKQIQERWSDFSNASVGNFLLKMERKRLKTKAKIIARQEKESRQSHGMARLINKDNWEVEVDQLKKFPYGEPVGSWVEDGNQFPKVYEETMEYLKEKIARRLEEEAEAEAEELKRKATEEEANREFGRGKRRRDSGYAVQ
ncbi:hypothetical protein HDU76_008008 [Blyttiomyces sp. JEL0837]|nr:hypothetical protein HDU76_008008 [Blyttiomyces sp. JEL0837]